MHTDGYLAIINNMSDGLITFDEHGNVQTFNPAAERIFGYKEAEIFGRNVDILISETGPAVDGAFFRRFFETGLEQAPGRVSECYGLRSNGILFPMELSVKEMNIDNKRIYMGIVRDITERREAELDIINGEKQLREAQRIAGLGFWEEDINTGSVFWSEQIYTICGYNHGQYVPARDKVLAMIHPEDRPGYKAAFINALKTNIPVDVETRVIDAGGRTIHLHVMGEVRYNMEDKPIRFFGTLMDITERKLGEKELFRYQKFFNFSRDTITYIDQDYIFRDINKRFLEIYGLERSKVIGHSTREISGKEFFDSVLKLQIDSAFSGNNVHFQTWLSSERAGKRYLDFMITPYEGEHGRIEGVIMSSRDITQLKLAEEGLRRSESRSLEAQNIARLGFWEMDLVSREVFWSDTVYGIYGVEKNRFVITDESFLNLIHPEDRLIVSNITQGSVDEDDKLQNLEFRIIRPDDGRERYIMLRAGLSKDESGKPQRILGTIVDITEKKRAEQVIRRYGDIINATEDMILFVDCNNRYLAVNRAFLNRYQLAEHEVIGRHAADVIGKDQFEKITGPLFRRCLEGEKFDHQHWFQYPGLGTRYVYASYNPYREDDGTVSGVVISVRDITEIKHYEMELQQAKMKAEEAALIKARFLANMSHELRTPLNAIIGYSEMMYEKAEETGDEENISDLNKIHTAGRHLLELINDTLDLSKIEAGKMTLISEIVDVKEVINEVTAGFVPLLSAKDNRLILNIEDEVKTMVTDETRLRQCLYNLLSNAVKFTDNGTIILKVRISKNRNLKWMVFEVSDTGVGIDKEKLAGIFDAFVQADKEYSTSYGGTGLGLAIVNEIALLMGGNISVISEPGHGSTFTLQLPARLETANSETANSGETSDELKNLSISPDKGPSVLVIDDDPESLGILTWHLKKGEYRVLTASNGEAGIKLAREAKPTAIILDVLMPKQDGWDVLTELKGDRNTARIPVVMCTIVDNASKGFALGANDYIVKPISRRRLLDSLKKYCTLDSCSVIVVEDDGASRELMERQLIMAGWDVTVAKNGREALECLEVKQPEVMLLDLMMPELDGFEVVEAMKKNENWKNIPILIMTAKELTDDDCRRLNGSVEGLMEKGRFSLDELLGHLNRIVKKPAPGQKINYA